MKKPKNLASFIIFSLCFSLVGIYEANADEKSSTSSQVVNITMPSDLNISFDSEGVASVNDLNIQNDNDVRINVNSLNVIKQNWSLIGWDEQPQDKAIAMKLNGSVLNNGLNNLSITIPKNSSQILDLDVKSKLFLQPVTSESAFDFEFDISLGQESFVASFNSDGGTSVSNINTKNGETITLPDAKTVTKTGYTLKYWQLNGVNYTPGSNFVMPIGNVTFKAIWEANTYTIAFRQNGGSGTTANITANYGVSYNLTKNGYSRTGYIFNGWNTKADGTGTSYADEQSVTSLSATNGDVVLLYAQWKIVNYSITYNLNNGIQGSNATTSYNVESRAITLPTPTRTGYTFGGWYDNSSFTGNAVTTIAAGSTGNKTYYAKWNLVTYNITYDLGGGTVSTSNPTSYNVETATFSLNNPTKTGYTFSGWTGSNGTSASKSVSISKGSTGNKTYTANWTANKYTVNYNANGGSGTTASSSHTYDTAKTLTANGFTRTGYTFLGWSTSSTATTATYTNGQSVKNLTSTSGGTVTLYAVWSINSYTLTYNPNGGSVTLPSTSIKYGATYGSLPTPLRPGYTFKGWFTAASGGTQVTSSTTMGASNTTIYAQWTANTYTVSYNANGGSGTTASSIHTYDTAKALTSNGFTKTGYTFAGWATSSSGSAVYTNGQSVKNLSATNGATVTLYAVWKANTYTVTYNGNGATGGSTASSAHTYGTAKTLTSNGFTKTGYTFAGWATSSNGSVVYSNAQSVSNLTAINGGSVTLYAKWTPNTYTITYNANGGSGTTASSSHTYDTTKTLTANGFTRTGYTFLGWSTNSSATTATYTNSQSVSNLTSSNGGTVTLYAVWKINTYTVNIALVERKTNTRLGNLQYTGTYGSSKVVSFNDMAGLTKPNDMTITFNSNANIIAYYNLIDYKISYNLDGGTVAGSTNPTTYTIYDSYILTNPEKTGYTFAGWYDNTTGKTYDSYVLPDIPENENNLRDVSLTAKWTLNSYNITYNLNGGTQASGAATKYNIETAVTLPTPTKNGYKFAGWYTNSSFTGSAVSSISKGSYGNKTYYARWVPATYTLTLNPNGGSVSYTSKSVVYGEAYGTLPTPTRNGYVFKGWFTSASGGTQVTSSTTMGTSNTTIYAQWAQTFTINIDLNDGTLNGKSGTVTVVGEKGKKLSDYVNGQYPQLDGYDFHMYLDADYGDASVGAFVGTDFEITKNLNVKAYYTPSMTRTITTDNGKKIDLIYVGHGPAAWDASGNISMSTFSTANDGIACYVPAAPLANTKSVLIQRSGRNLSIELQDYGISVLTDGSNPYNFSSHSYTGFTNQYVDELFPRLFMTYYEYNKNLFDVQGTFATNRYNYFSNSLVLNGTSVYVGGNLGSLPISTTNNTSMLFMFDIQGKVHGHDGYTWNGETNP